jgi:hypothetical protein
VGIRPHAVNRFTKCDQEGTPVSNFAEGDELLHVALIRFALSPVSVRAQWLDFDDSEIAVHLAGNMDQEIRFRILKDSFPDDGVPAFVDFTCKRVRPVVEPRLPQLMVQLVRIDPFTVLDERFTAFVVSDRQKKILRRNPSCSVRKQTS